MVARIGKHQYLPPFLYCKNFIVFEKFPKRQIEAIDAHASNETKTEIGTMRASRFSSEDDMFDIHTEHVGDVAVVQCEGRIVQSDAAFRLRDVVRSQRNCRVVLVDLSEVEEIEGGGLGMLAYLQRWANEHHIKMKLFNPSTMVNDRLERTYMPHLEMATTDEMIALLDRAEGGRFEAHS